MTTNRHIFVGMQILTPTHYLQDHAVVVEGNTISAIIPKEMVKHHLPAKEWVYPASYFLVPGFIDLHVHGANGYDVMDGTPDSLAHISKALSQEGVTSFLATTLTAPKENLETVLINTASFTSENYAECLGIHLEGPFISPQKKGAQSQENCLNPDLDLLQHFIKLSNHTIKIVTLAPELPGVASLIHYLNNAKIITSVGHTNASFDETETAIHEGASHATHLFNAMSGIHQRHPGAVTALLKSNRVNAELIVDGIHLHPAIVELTYRLKTKANIVLVTDAMRGKCLEDGKYTLGNQQVTVKDGYATLPDGTLAGSTLKMPDAIKNMITFTGCTLQDAIHMATKNPAEILGWGDKKGIVEVGAVADIVILNGNLEVEKTMCRGRFN